MAELQPYSSLFESRLNGESTSCIIYTESINSRLSYVCEFIFNFSLGIHFELTDSRSHFEQSSKFKINYSNQSLLIGFQIGASTLMFEKGVHQKKPEAYFKNDRLYFYKTNLEKVDQAIHFDLFASVFYFISRYEEWQVFEPDQHGRFGIKNSLLYQHQFHLQPLVDLWIKEFKELWKLNEPTIQLPEFKAKLISTIDVDNLYAFKAKGIFRTIGAICRDVVKLNSTSIAKRTKVLLTKEKDPFDIYEEVSTFCESNQIPLVYFFLYKTGTTYDRTVQPNSKAFLKVFEKLKKSKVLIGLHPSYYSILDAKALAAEFDDISNSLGQKIELSRQHYLRFDMRSTPQQLMRQGVLADFTMGYSNSPGFRAGTSLPFKYYDLESEEATPLWLVPFCFMDGAYSIHHKISVDEALSNILKMAESIRQTGGVFISVFHERSFYDHLYPGFGRLYNKMNLEIKQLFLKQN